MSEGERPFSLTQHPMPRHHGLEVSGTLHGNLLARTQAKQQQLLANPFMSKGYVWVVHFGEALVQLALYGGEF